ncbi:unnamed protein product [Chironomus riparius]|uniref:Uncharacterized protein n=1 Tax=Chironomus riparius TaxID=315576 RepID=A0A9N9WZC1_9DIPT|nr:unnamed protein product [Chironomus riparius]
MMNLLILCLLLKFSLTASQNVQELTCEEGTIRSVCIIDGSKLDSMTQQLKISNNSSKHFQLHLKNFRQLQSDLIVVNNNVRDLFVVNSTILLVNRTDFVDLTVQHIFIINSTASFDAGSLSSFKSLINFNLINSKISKINPCAFEELPNVTKIDLTNTSLSDDLVTAVEALENIKKLVCTNCKLNDEQLMKIVKSHGQLDTILLPSNAVKSLKCDKIKNLKLSELDLSCNNLSKTFQTCKIVSVDVTENKIDTLHIQYGTKTIEAAKNLISKIKCEYSLNTVEINLNKNLLTDLMCISSISTLEYLSINSNKFKNFKLYAFEQMTRLRYISAMDNPIYLSKPNLFAPESKSPLERINVDKFDFGYEKLRFFYPKLEEVFHYQFTGSCEKYFQILDILKEQNINFYVFKAPSCCRTTDCV